MNMLGKIQKVYFGYDDFLFGLHLELSGVGWGCMTSICYNPSYIYESKELHSLTMLSRLQELLKEAKVTKVEQLINKPIEAVFEHNSLISFRLLTEVL